MIKKRKFVFLSAAALILSLQFSSAQAAAHALGSNIVTPEGTVYTITKENDQTVRRPYTSPGAFLSFSYNTWETISGASSEDMSLPVGSFIAPQDGKIICSDRGGDKGTCYLITSGKKAGFTSANVFTQLGYNFSYVMSGDVSFLSSTANIDTPTAPHNPGALINKDGTIYLVANNGLLGLPSWNTLKSWGYLPTDIIPANSADRNLSVVGTLVPKQPEQISPTNLDNAYPTATAVPTLIVSDTFVSFNYSKGGAVPQAYAAHISNSSNSSSLNYTISVPNQPAWLNTAYTTNGLSLAPLQSGGIGISVDPTNLAVGTYNTTINFTGNFSNSPASITVSLKVASNGDALQITSTTLPDATVGQAYSTQLQASGGVVPYKWSPVSTTYPSGCCVLGINGDGSTFNTQSSATVLAPAGSYSWVVKVTDSVGNTSTKTLYLTINPATTAQSPDFYVISGDISPKLSNETNAIEINKPAIIKFIVGNKGGNYSAMPVLEWQFPTGAVPVSDSGIAENTCKNLSQLTAGQTCTFAVKLTYSQVTTVSQYGSVKLVIDPQNVITESDKNNNWMVVNFDVKVAQSSNPAITITTNTLPTATVGQSYSADIYFTKTTNYALNATISGQPSGIGFGGVSGPNANMGIVFNYTTISGIPTQAGTYTLKIILTDQYNAPVSKDLTLVVNP